MPNNFKSSSALSRFENTDGKPFMFIFFIYFVLFWVFILLSFLCAYVRIQSYISRLLIIYGNYQLSINYYRCFALSQPHQLLLDIDRAQPAEICLYPAPAKSYKNVEFNANYLMLYISLKLLVKTTTKLTECPFNFFIT